MRRQCDRVSLTIHPYLDPGTIVSESNCDLVEPKGHWLTGHLRQFRDNRLGLFVESARMAPIVKLRLGTRRAYILSHPDLIRDVLVTRHRHLARDDLANRILMKILGKGLITSEGDYWKRQRRMIAPAFHLQRVQGYADVMVAHARALGERWLDGQVADIGKEMDKLTLSIVTAALLKVDSLGYAQTVADIIPRLNGIATRQIARLFQVPDWLPTRENRTQRALTATLDRFVLAEIRKRRESDADSDDLLTMMVRMEDAETGERMTEEEIRSEVITVYLAGYITTALTLTFCWYHLAREPDIAARLHSELDSVLNGRPPGLEDLKRLRYTRMLFSEALRLYPAVYFVLRAVVEPIELGGHVIPAGSVLMMSPFAMHRHPDLWDDPERFDPERFANDAERGWHKFKYFPFGGGPHICVGNQFAPMEGLLILATLAQRYDVELADPTGGLELDPQITLGPKGGVPLRILRRASSAMLPVGTATRVRIVSD